MSSTETTETGPLPIGKYDADFEALNEASRWLNHINLRRHRGNPEIRAAIHAARDALNAAEDALLEVEQR